MQLFHREEGRVAITELGCAYPRTPHQRSKPQFALLSKHGFAPAVKSSGTVAIHVAVPLRLR